MTVYGPGSPNPTFGNVTAAEMTVGHLETRVGNVPPLITGLLPVSGVGQQLDSTQDRFMLVPISYNPTAVIPAECNVEVSPDGITYITADTVIFPSVVVPDPYVIGIKLYMPAGWYFRLTTNIQATISVGIYW